MCGIAGLIGPWENVGGSAANMLTQIEHRGPDGVGLWADTTDATIGHVRLSIIDVSTRARQPMTLADCEDLVLSFNGEIYNYQDIREKLDRNENNIPWKSESDTEVVLRAIHVWGLEAAIACLTGQFAIAVWNKRSRKLWLVRDRMGEKPLYFLKSQKKLAFASEISSLTSLLGDRKAHLDDSSVEMLLRYAYIDGNRSIWRNVDRVQPGEIVEFDLDIAELVRHKYWSLPDVIRKNLGKNENSSDAELIEELDERLQKVVKNQMIADVPLGCFLSGGIDSSTVAGIMQSFSSKPVHTFSIGFEDARYDESVHARTVADHLGTNHSELIVKPKHVTDLIVRLGEIFSEPFADVSQIPTILVSQMAVDKIKVALSGDGADELFAGYNRHVACQKVWPMIQRVPWFLRAPLAKVIEKTPNSFLKSTFDSTFFSKLFEKRFRLLDEKIKKMGLVLGSRDIEAFHESLSSQWQNPTEAMTANPAWDPSTHDAWSMRVSNMDLTDLDKLLLADQMRYLPGDILQKVDRSSMSASLECRAPFLDHDLVAFSWTLPLRARIRDGQGKWLLRQVLNRYVPKELTDRPKMGFGIPIGEFLRADLHDWCDGLLSTEALSESGLFDPENIRDVWDTHRRGKEDMQYRLWPVLMFQAWYQKWV